MVGDDDDRNDCYAVVDEYRLMSFDSKNPMTAFAAGCKQYNFDLPVIRGGDVVLAPVGQWVRVGGRVDLRDPEIAPAGQMDEPVDGQRVRPDVTTQQQRAQRIASLG